VQIHIGGVRKKIQVEIFSLLFQFTSVHVPVTLRRLDLGLNNWTVIASFVKNLFKEHTTLFKVVHRPDVLLVKGEFFNENVKYFFLVETMNVNIIHIG